MYGRGTGPGIGLVPIPGNWTMAMVDNQCPECAFGSIDLSETGDGRWRIEWYPVEVGSRNPLSAYPRPAHLLGCRPCSA